MRDINRIKEFCDELAEIWETNCPDWRFGQLISNVFGQMRSEGKDCFFPEEKEMMEYFKNYFSPKTEDNIEDEKERQKGKCKNICLRLSDEGIVYNYCCHFCPRKKHCDTKCEWLDDHESYVGCCEYVED